ncbi:outer membrane protein assembly factor BamB family protein [Streptomyces calidiresistens]|uniref:PQQ-binding-like beta-propeller repeat protein n=1 Tax=Streptomyces calidiresistens TaxID=1485586 RepID=A0A7W3T039_9ACTN|nr:PQQ-binding-like beta-propeller repeat protein [Streptomyces calidiresistens]MBB0228462.1 PQQ-binding-like beta-propeller repeat protein [Streptomyces calidiresistens]
MPPPGQPPQPGAVPPPGQPPAGYGYPTQPPAPQPGYGYPQQPPQPGYGYPQQPPAGFGAPGAPAAPGPYGQPGAPGPYGAPTGPMPGYGRPQQPPQPGAVPGKPGGGGNAPRMVLIIGVVLAVLLAGGFGAYYVLTGGSDDDAPSATGPDTGTDGGSDSGTDDGSGGDEEPGGDTGLPEGAVEAELVMEIEQPDVPEEDILTEAYGYWVVEDSLVRVMTREVVSHDLNTGEQQWSFPLPNNECRASHEHSEGRIAILQGRDCEVLTVLDITTGEDVWTTTIDADVTPGRYSVPAILGDTVALGWTLGGHGWSISQEKALWEPRSREDCKEDSYAVMDGVFISKVGCGFIGDDGGSIRATEEDGTELWSWEYPAEQDGKKLRFRSVISADPLVVRMDLGEIAEAEEQIWVIDADREDVAHVLPYDRERHVSPCDAVTLSWCPAAVVHDGMMYLASTDRENSVIAFDLSTGTAVWEVASEEGATIMPMQEQDGKILAYEIASTEQPGAVVAIDPATESAELVMVLPRESREAQRRVVSDPYSPEDRPFWADNRLILLSQRFYDHTVGDPVTMVFR